MLRLFAISIVALVLTSCASAPRPVAEEEELTGVWRLIAVGAPEGLPDGSVQLLSFREDGVTVHRCPGEPLPLAFRDGRLRRDPSRGSNELILTECPKTTWAPTYRYIDRVLYAEPELKFAGRRLIITADTGELLVLKRHH
ncbi:hypothetical protein NOG11_03230 [Parvularcula sp. BGMRC 0090]|uniref:META domain-containing protein n=1 Tax=Parvularcula maris TaxID=2965077 RepID=A0A9X2L7B2_9PROT|nr:hypothetical protein [Parvularcula maris]